MIDLLIKIFNRFISLITRPYHLSTGYISLYFYYRAVFSLTVFVHFLWCFHALYIFLTFIGPHLPMTMTYLCKSSYNLFLV